MMQPFVLFEKKYLAGLLNMRRYHVILQTYPEAVKDFGIDGKINLLLTEYVDAGIAVTHFKAVMNDSEAKQLDIKTDNDRGFLLSLLSDTRYRVFWSVILDEKVIKKRFDNEYKDKTRKYILQKTNWQLGKIQDVEAVGFLVKFGQLFVHLSWHEEKLDVRLSEIEEY